MVKEISLEELRSVPLFEGLADETLQWLQSRGELLEFEPGGHLFSKGKAADHLLAVLNGKFQVKFEIGGQLLPIATIEPGQVTGVLPYSRMKEASGYATAIENARVLALHRDLFKEMESVDTELVRRLVEHMLNRVREGTRNIEQREKLSALGKLSAGLAHELNNPAAAIVRTAAELRKQIECLPDDIKDMSYHPPTPEQIQTVIQIVDSKKAKNMNPHLSMVEKSELEDEIVDWLEDHDIEDGFDMAESFIETGLCVGNLEEIAEKVPEKSLSNVLHWLDTSLTSKRLIMEIEDAAKRISDLVGSIKSYTHMDRSPDKANVDVREGIDNTLVMLGHKIKKKNIQLTREYGDNLPTIKAFAGELNQVWTNLIDNALDAMDREGELTIKVKKEIDCLKINFVDNGPGIPKEVLGKIFDPFFTTKPQGQGTGMGLDIVNRIITNHNGIINVNSEPGKTEFAISIGIDEEGC